MTIRHLPDLGYFVLMEVFVPDGEDVSCLVGPYRSAEQAREHGPKAERGVLHLAR